MTMDKVTVSELRSMRVGDEITKKFQDRLSCNSARNLVSHVNVTYPIEGCRYTTHLDDGFVLTIKLIRKKEKNYGDIDLSRIVGYGG